VKVASADGKSIEAAIKWIKSITDDPEEGAIYQGTVVKTVDFGAFVNFFGPKDGLVHISQLAPERVKQDHRCRQGRRQGLGEASRLRRSRQGAPWHEDGRSGNW
jgi:polyribonucleotide nucleotidyltransferase